MPSIAPPRRVVRVRASSSAPAESPIALPVDSMAYSLALAARVLAQVTEGRSLTEALAGLAGLRDAPAGARAAAQDVAYGVLRSHGRGQFMLQQLMSKPLTHRETEALLLAAVYRLDTRPESSYMVVDQAVSAAGELAGGVFKGLVNGVLRNYLRRRNELVRALAGNEEANLQHPRWWLDRLRRYYPQCWEAIVSANNSAPPMTLRVNRRRISREDYLVRLEADGRACRPVGEQGVILEVPVPVDALPGFADGMVSVQDAGAQRAADLLAPKPGARVLDACAAPGGKTAHLLEKCDLEFLALDIDARRVRRIEENLQRLGLKATTKAADALETSAWWDGRPFDNILADVPCSASGILRRHPDIKVLRRESDIRPLVRTQAALLDSLWPSLAPGGTMLYATCSVFPEENGAQIDAFLVRAADARKVAEEQWLPQDEHDGFYYALLEKAV